MGNILYFRMTHAQTNYYGIAIKSFKVYFTAESNFTETVAPKPQTVSSEGVSYVNFPFATQKIDVGKLETKTFGDYYNSRKYLVYSYKNVDDLKANIVLFEDDAVNTSGEIGEYGKKGITSVNLNGEYYYGLNNNTYFVESPTNAVTKNGKNVNLGYRIVAAKVNYKYGGVSGATEAGFYIVRTSGGTKYYMDTDCKFTTTPVVWNMDGNSRIYSGEKYLTYTINYNYNDVPVWYYYRVYGWYQTDETVSYGLKSIDFSTTTSVNDAKAFNISNNGYFYTNITYNEEARVSTRGWVEHVVGVNSTTSSYYIKESSSDAILATGNNGNRATQEVRTIEGTKQTYTLKLYDKEGKNVYGDPNGIDVNENNQEGNIEINGLNNDAIKFSIENLPDNAKAFVTVELTMQPLNPYISSLDIVCHDPNLEGNPAISKNLTQQFVSEDFTVRGGKFVFYVPVGFDTKTDAEGNVISSGQECTFTFENLKHAYGDETYYDGTGNGHARYYLVNSEYEVKNPSAYGSDPGADYKKKVYVVESGTQKFTFSNAESLDHTSTGNNNVYYEEYPFSKAIYQNQGGTFEKLKMKNGENKIRYLFTADETRYNIAPSKATEHRVYAFYTMDVQLITKTYNPAHKWVKIYDATCYDENGKDEEKPMYGLKLLTEKVDGEYGYLTSDQIHRILNNNDDKKYYSGNYTPVNNRPADIESTDQVLYIDASELQAVVYRKVVSEDEEPDLVRIQNQLGANGLFFLPEGVTFNGDNFAYKTGESFRTGSNIVLTDKKPFFSPYDIQVDTKNYAKYNRMITMDKNGKVSSATIMLPFTMSVDENAVHTNDDGKCSFQINVMQASNCMSDGQQDGGYNTQTASGHYAHFVPYVPEDGSMMTKANKPYMVKVESFSEDNLDATDKGKLSFVVTQSGALIEGTPLTSTSDTEIIGETSSGKIKNSANEAAASYYTFTNKASYSGKKIVRTDVDNNVFYFAGNHYTNLHVLKPKYEFLYVYPFRGVYYYTKSTEGAKDFDYLELFYGENMNDEDDGVITDINLVNDNGLKITTGKGFVSIASNESQNVDIYSVNGMKQQHIVLKAGEQKTTNLPAGIYLINGIKYSVK